VTCIGSRLGIRAPLATAVMLLFVGATRTSAQPSRQLSGPVMGESVRLWWYNPGIDSGSGPVGTDSVACGRFREIRGDTMIVTRLDGSPGQRACGTAPRPRESSAPIDVSYRLADIRSFYVHRPREARRVGWTDARQGMGEGGVMGLALGAVFGSIVGKFDDGRVLEDGLLGAGIGVVTGTIGGGLMSYQSGYDGGWVWMTVPRPGPR
jgi:hypothetical protein